MDQWGRVHSKEYHFIITYTFLGIFLLFFMKKYLFLSFSDLFLINYRSWIICNWWSVDLYDYLHPFLDHVIISIVCVVWCLCALYRNLRLQSVVSINWISAFILFPIDFHISPQIGPGFIRFGEALLMGLSVMGGGAFTWGGLSVVSFLHQYEVFFFQISSMYNSIHKVYNTTPSPRPTLN